MKQERPRWTEQDMTDAVDEVATGRLTAYSAAKK